MRCKANFGQKCRNLKFVVAESLYENKKTACEKAVWLKMCPSNSATSSSCLF